MEIYPYIIRLIDPLFYSHEALSGAFTPVYLHATAINHAVAWSMGKPREDQSYIISDEKGGRNIPRYEHSWIEPDFYFTPASIDGDVDYIVETVKGDMDYLIQPGFGQAKILGKNIGRNEVLKAYRIFSLPPETVFTGYLHAEPETIKYLPAYIRLGSFRGKAELKVSKALKTVGAFSNQYVDHPVDPLISRVKRGVMIGMFPYPIVDSALVTEAYEIRKRGNSVFVAVPSRPISYDKKALIKRLEDLKPGLARAKNSSLLLEDRAYLILHMLRTAISVKLFLQGIPGEERLDAVLNEIEEIESIRKASKRISANIEEFKLLGLIEKIQGIINECEKKISGDSEGKTSKSSRDSSSSIIL